MGMWNVAMVLQVQIKLPGKKDHVLQQLILQYNVAMIKIFR